MSLSNCNTYHKFYCYANYKKTRYTVVHSVVLISQWPTDLKQLAQYFGRSKRVLTGVKLSAEHLMASLKFLNVIDSLDSRRGFSVMQGSTEELGVRRRTLAEVGRRRDAQEARLLRQVRQNRQGRHQPNDVLRRLTG